MNIAKYLERIKFDDKVAVDLDVLSKLQKHHLLNIPFENLDIHSQTVIELDTQKIYEKIVLNKRGGFCYELNGLFNALLQKIGYNSRMISGRVFTKEKGYGKEYDHLSLIVELNNEAYIVDVGFGEFVFSPLKIELNTIQIDERGSYFIDKHDDNYFRVNKLNDGEPTPQFIFTKTARAYSEFNEMCTYHQTSSKSHFLKSPFLGIPIDNGRVSLVDKTLKISKGDVVEERQIPANELDNVLKKYFNF